MPWGSVDTSRAILGLLDRLTLACGHLAQPYPSSPALAQVSPSSRPPLLQLFLALGNHPKSTTEGAHSCLRHRPGPAATSRGSRLPRGDLDRVSCAERLMQV